MLVHRLSKCKTDGEAAQKIGAQILNEPIPLSDDSADSAMRHFGRLGMRSAMLDAVDLMRKGARRPEHVFVSAMNACSKLGLQDEGLSLFNELKNGDSDPDITNSTGCSFEAYVSALRVCASASDSKTALALISEVDSYFSTNMNATLDAGAHSPPILDAYNLALRSCADGQADAAQQLWDSMCEAGIAYNDESYNAMVANFAGSGDWEKVLATISELQKRVLHRVDRETLEAGVKACSEIGEDNWELALKFEHNMRKLAMPVSDDTTILCMQICEKAQQWSEVVNLFGRKMRIMRPPPEAYRAVRVACIQGEMTTQAKLWGLFD